ncbi:MAG: hypothetical protein KBC41_02130 [Candidatus Pacebacteria bacterium]|nr:hypothetical protein [Candidatus Paceibacterota bacterium]
MKIQKVKSFFSCFFKIVFISLLVFSFSYVSGVTGVTVVNAGTGSDSDGGAEGDVGGFGGETGCGNNASTGGGVQGDGGGDGGSPSTPTCSYDTAWCNSIGWDVAHDTVCGWCNCTGARTYVDNSAPLGDGRGGSCTDPLPPAPSVDINFSFLDKVKIFLSESFVGNVFALKR